MSTILVLNIKILKVVLCSSATRELACVKLLIKLFAISYLFRATTHHAQA
jgi:hypothetical protein